MNNQFDHKPRKNRALKIVDILGDVIQKDAPKFNKLEFVINLKWQEIIGDFFGPHTEPDRINITNNTRNNSNKYEGVLHVNISSAAALEFQHFQERIISKINSFVGYRAITKIVLHQVHDLKKSSNPSTLNNSKKVIDTEDEIRLKKTTSNIKDKNLKNELFKLGTSILKYED